MIENDNFYAAPLVTAVIITYFFFLFSHLGFSLMIVGIPLYVGLQNVSGYYSERLLVVRILYLLDNIGEIIQE